MYILLKKKKYKCTSINFISNLLDEKCIMDDKFRQNFYTGIFKMKN